MSAKMCQFSSSSVAHWRHCRVFVVVDEKKHCYRDYTQRSRSAQNDQWFGVKFWWQDYDRWLHRAHVDCQWHWYQYYGRHLETSRTRWNTSMHTITWNESPRPVNS